MSSDEQIARLLQGSAVWNQWLLEHRAMSHGSGAEHFRPELSGADLSGINLSGAILAGAILNGADLSGADLTGVVLTGAKLAGADLGKSLLRGAKLSGANLHGANLWSADLRQADLSGAQLTLANLSGASLTGADLSGANGAQAEFGGADLSDATLRSANVSGADLSGADVSGADFSGANLNETNVIAVRWDRARMRGRYHGIRGIDSCYGNALFKRAAADQDYLDTLEADWRGSWRSRLFWAWGQIDYGRSLPKVALCALGLVSLFGAIYSVWPRMLGYETWADDRFTPFYFSIVTYTTLGFGDISPKGHFWGEIIVSAEVVVGYATLGLLLSVLAEKIARRS